LSGVFGVPPSGNLTAARQPRLPGQSDRRPTCHLDVSPPTPPGWAWPPWPTTWPGRPAPARRRSQLRAGAAGKGHAAGRGHVVW